MYISIQHLDWRVSIIIVHIFHFFALINVHHDCLTKAGQTSITGWPYYRGRVKFHDFLNNNQNGVSVKCRPDTCGWRMRMGKCAWKKMWITKKLRRKKREMRMAKKINKQTNKGKKSFFQVAVKWLNPSLTYRT